MSKNNQFAAIYIGKGDQGRMKNNLAGKAKANSSHLSKSEWKGADFISLDKNIERAAEKEEAVEMALFGWHKQPHPQKFYNINTSPGVKRINTDGF